MPNPISRMSVPPARRRASAPAGRVLPLAIAAGCLLVAGVVRADPSPAGRSSPLRGSTARMPAEDGYRLWLRYVPVEGDWRSRYRASATELVGRVESASSSLEGASVSTGTSPTLRAVQAELLRGLTGLLGSRPPLVSDVTR